MATEIHVPTLGESVTEATIAQWFKKLGDSVSADEPLVELETDKVSVEVPAPASGKLEEITIDAGETVEVGALLGRINESAAASTDVAKNKTNSKKPTTESKPVSKVETPPSPSAAKLMTENELVRDQVEGSGKRGQILKSDVLDKIESDSSPTKSIHGKSLAVDEVREERVRMTKLRQTIAQRLKDAQNTAAMLTTYNEVDMGSIMNLRSQYKELFEKKHGVKLGFMGFFTMAVCHALKEIPAVNAEIDGTDIVYKNYYNIGVAVGTDKGLVVPVVRDANRMTIAEIEKEIGNLGMKARDGKLAIEDMMGGTFTISNGGVYGSLMSSPIINAPQSGILGMHKIQERPMAIDGQIVIRPMMYLALSYDHRIIDGKEAVTFLVRVKEGLEDPQRMVLDL